MAATIIPGSCQATNETYSGHTPPVRQIDLPSDGSPPVHPRATPLRIGYISSFFQDDNWMKPVWPLIITTTAAALKFTSFPSAPPPPSLMATVRIRLTTTTTYPASTNESAAKLIRKAAIDLLIDLNGFSRLARLPLFSYRPAPVVIGWFNMYATTGSEYFDYLVGDDQCIPASEEQFYSEKILRVPGSYLTFSVDYPVPPITDPPCLVTSQITYGSLASQYKLSPAVIAAWSGILAATPNSRLLLKNKQLASQTTCEYVYGCSKSTA